MIRIRDMLIVGLVIALIASGVWFFIKGQNDNALGAGGLPLIKADTNPVKLPPEDPGGEVMPNADSTVFSAMGIGNETDPSMEGVKPPEEQPAETPVDTGEFAGLRTGFAVPSEPEVKTESLFDKSTFGDSGSGKYLSGFIENDAPPSEPVIAPGDDKPVVVEDAPEDVKIEPAKVAEDAAVKKADTKKTEPKPEAGKEEAPVPMPAPITEESPADTPVPDAADATAAAQNMEAAEKAAISKPGVTERIAEAPAAEASKPVETPKAEVKKEEPKKAETKPEDEPYKPAKPKSSGGPSGYYIQLASSPAGADLSRTWAAMKAKYGAALSGLQPVYQNASIPGKGDYVRLQAGPMTQPEANSRCKSLRAIDPKGACLVVKR